MKNDENPIIQPEAEAGSGLTREEVLQQLLERLKKSPYPTVSKEYGAPLRGVETGLDEAFLIDRPTYEALIASDPNSAAILKKFANTQNIDRWRAESQETWLINTVPGSVDIDKYPAVKAHLERYRDRLEKRGTETKWYELAQANHLEPARMADLKVLFRENSSWPGGFALDKSGTYHSAAGFYLPNGDYYIAGLLNSRIYWFMLNAMSPASTEGVMALKPEHIEALPVPRLVDVEHISMLGSFSEYCHRMAEERHEFHEHVRREIANHLAPGQSLNELSATLNNWHLLTIDTLVDEVNRLYGKEISGDMLPMWEEFLGEAKYQLNRINTDITQAERKLDLVVYQIFELTEEEIEHMDKF